MENTNQSKQQESTNQPANTLAGQGEQQPSNDQLKPDDRLND